MAVMKDEKGPEGLDDSAPPGDTRNRILLAAIAVIERDGADATTVRSIALEAGVNIAAINYHYRSKSELMEAALVETWQHASTDVQELLGQDSLRQALSDVALYLLRGGARFPRVTQAHLLGFGSFPPPSMVLKAQREFTRRIAARIMEETGPEARGEPSSALLQRCAAFIVFCYASALSPSVFPEGMERNDWTDCAALLVDDLLALALPAG